MSRNSKTPAAKLMDRRRELRIPKKRAESAWREAQAFKRRCAQDFKTVQGKPLKIEPWEMLVVFALCAGVREILVLVPKGNGKTTLAAAIGADHLNRVDQAEVYIGASTREQADKMFREAWSFGYSLGLEPLPGYKQINRRDPDAPDDVPSRRVPVLGVLKVLASDKLGKGTLEGIAPTLGLIDEYHAHRSSAIYEANHGALHKRDGQLLTISTAGHDEDGPLGQLRRGALALPNVNRAGGLTIATDERGEFVMFEFACEPDSDLDNIANVARANPASFVTQPKLRKLRRSPAMTSARWARYHCNVWREGEEIWLGAGEWNKSADPELPPPELGQPIVLGLDFARSYDCAALVRLYELDPGAEDERICVDAQIWQPDPSRGQFIPYAVVEDAIRDQAERYDVTACGFDRHLFKRSAELLEDEGIPMIVVPMNAGVWVPLTAELLEAIRTGRFVHNGDPELAKHINAGELADTPTGQRLHGRTKRRVDALIAFGCAYQVWGTSVGDSWSERFAAGEAMF